MQKNFGKFILLIDDSEDIQSLLTTLFEHNGYRVECMSNGSEALSFLRELTVIPDLILLDAQMPVMDGYEFRHHQQSDPRLRNIPVIVMSGDDDMAMAERMIHPEAMLVKPLRIQSILNSLSEVFSPAF